MESIKTGSGSLPDVDIALGFLETPRNSLMLTAKFLPNKAGGAPVKSMFLLTINLGMAD